MTARKLLHAAFGAFALAAAPVAAPVQAQTVEVSTLTAPDLFSTGGRETGLSTDLWKGASARIARAVIPMLANRPLSPAARALALRVLATAAQAPDGAGQDAALAGARINALIALGDPKAASAILDRVTGVDLSPELSQAAAEAALLAGNDPRACAVGQALTVGRDGPYWLKLRAYCQVIQGDAGAAQLTFELAQTQAPKDATYVRLMTARMAGAPYAGAASLRNGLDLALSRGLGLDLSKAAPSPAVAAAVDGADPKPAAWVLEAKPGEIQSAIVAFATGDAERALQIRAALPLDAAGFDLALLDALIAAGAGKTEPQVMKALIAQGLNADAKLRPRAQAAALLFAALGAPLDGDMRADFAGFTVGDPKAPPARMTILDAAAAGRLQGETALVALWIAADAGRTGPSAADRARIVAALRLAGLEADARAFAVEGLLAQR